MKRNHSVSVEGKVGSRKMNEKDGLFPDAIRNSDHSNVQPLNST